MLLSSGAPTSIGARSPCPTRHWPPEPPSLTQPAAVPPFTNCVSAPFEPLVKSATALLPVDATITLLASPRTSLRGG